MTLELFQTTLIDAAMAGLGFLSFGTIAAYCAYMFVNRKEF